MAKRSKRPGAAAGKDPSRLQGDAKTKRLDPLAKKLILLAVVLVAAGQLFVEELPGPVSDGMVLLGGVLALGALTAQLKGRRGL